MTMALRLLLRVVKRRVERGETLERVLGYYPKLTEEEKQEIRAAGSEK